jgi:hypothetical protein
MSHTRSVGVSRLLAIIARMLCLSRLILPLLALLAIQQAFAQDNPSPMNSDVENSVSTLVKMHQVWGAKASTANTSLAIKEASRSGPVVRFWLYGQGLPADGVYSIVAWPVTQRLPSEVQRGVTLDASGLAICAGTPETCSGDKPDDPIDLAFSPAPGEPLRLGLVSAGGATKVFAKMVPIPLRGEDRGCAAEATLLMPGAALVLIEGSGFLPNGDVTMDSRSEGERHGGKGKVDADGKYVTAILPAKQGVKGGTAKVTLKSAQCSPSVTFAWGRH